MRPHPDLDAELQRAAETHAPRVLEALDYVGVLAIELFQAGDELLANEMAPRVHNSGHWTIEGARRSQFENHLRAVCGCRSADGARSGYAAMVNLIGDVPDARPCSRIPGAHLHLYGKAPRPGRKLGHVTLRADDQGTLEERLDAVLAIVGS